MLFQTFIILGLVVRLDVILTHVPSFAIVFLSPF